MTAILLVGSAIAVLALDQATKALVSRRLSEGERLLLARHASLRRIINARASRLPLSTRTAVLIWIALAGTHFALLALDLPLPPAAAMGLGFVLGGAAGNLLDRLAHGGVIDFISLGRWPTFNLADAGMVAGVVLIIGQALVIWGPL